MKHVAAILETASFMLAVVVLCWCFGVVAINVWRPLVHFVTYHASKADLTLTVALLVAGSALAWVVFFAWRPDR